MTYRPIPSNEFIGWYEIPGYSGYCASRKGEILTKKTKNATLGGRAGRYLKVSVYRDGESLPHLQYVHVLICRAFYGIGAPGMVVKHGDDNRFNNKPNNLSWGTQSDNILDTYRNGLRQPTYGPRRVALEDFDVNDRMVTLYNEDYAMSLLKSLADELPVTHIPLSELNHLSTDNVAEEQYINADVLTPLILLNGVSFTLIDGFYRLAHHRHLNSVEIPVKLIEPASLNLEVGLEANKTWDPRFAPCYTPLEMLELGVFEGKYINSVKGLPGAWYKVKKVLGPNDAPDPKLNKFGVKSRMSLSAWRENGWIKTDKNGWFEWYCHYFLGRRLGDEDNWQIGRWNSLVARHQGQINATGKRSDLSVNPKQRQGLLQWGWDSTKVNDQTTRAANLKRLKRHGVGIEEFSIFDNW